MVSCTKIRNLLLALLILLCGFSKVEALTIVDFGTDAQFAPAFMPTFTDFDNLNQTVTDLNLIGDKNDTVIGNLVNASNQQSSVDISNISNAIIVLVGTLTGSTIADGEFQIELFDADGDSRIYGGTWGDFFLNQETDVLLSFQLENGTFNPMSIVSVGLIGGGLDSESLEFTATSLLAVPEPSSIALFSVASAAGFFAILRRRNFRKSSLY